MTLHIAVLLSAAQRGHLSYFFCCSLQIIPYFFGVFFSPVFGEKDGNKDREIIHGITSILPIAIHLYGMGL